MKLNFCTLFNSAYLARGLAMYQSLLQHCDDFHLYIYAFDSLTLDYFRLHQFEHITVVSLNEFEDSDLLRIKPSRSAGEYCWTCTSSTILFSIQNFKLSNCTYLDADLFFYSNPRVLIDEMGDNSVMITEHRFTKEYNQAVESGKYCVQFVTFKNDERGMKVLQWWRERCIEWCYAFAEDGKFGDQKYLDDWTTRFEGVHELQHLGGGIAPWNMQQYSFQDKKGNLTGTEIKSGNKFEVVFFHFHGVKFFNDNIVCYSNSLYALSEEVKFYFYKPYVKSLLHIAEKISSFDANGSAGKSPMQPLSVNLLLKFYLSGLKKSLLNVFGKDLKKKMQHHYFYFTDNL